MINYFSFDSSFNLINIAFDMVADDAFFTSGLFNTVAGLASTTFTTVGTPLSTTYSSIAQPTTTTWSNV
tara:strand:- start:618 stop:824 length:207 start_codon:yes stop_codon:yes gene_type:complete